MAVLARRKHPVETADMDIGDRLDQVAERLEKITNELERKLMLMRDERGN